MTYLEKYNQNKNMIERYRAFVADALTQHDSLSIMDEVMKLSAENSRIEQMKFIQVLMPMQLEIFDFSSAMNEEKSILTQ